MQLEVSVTELRSKLVQKVPNIKCQEAQNKQ